jgi:hypothetical protein
MRNQIDYVNDKALDYIKIIADMVKKYIKTKIFFKLKFLNKNYLIIHFKFG